MRVFLTLSKKTFACVLAAIVVACAAGVSFAISSAGAKNENGKYTIEITNDGEKPKDEIIEGGGLSGLRLLVERENGTMIIHSVPQFKLIIELPQGETL